MYNISTYTGFCYFEENIHFSSALHLKTAKLHMFTVGIFSLY